MKRFFELAVKILLLGMISYILLVVNVILVLGLFKPSPPFPIGIISLTLALIEARLLYMLYKKSKGAI